MPHTLRRVDVTGKRVLVVDDEPMVREVLTAYLDRDGFEVSEAATGPEALDQVSVTSPHLVVLDLMLPGVDGLSVLSEMRRFASTPVILLTARADEGDRVLGLELGADDYVVKPFSPRELVARVRAVLKRTELRPDPGVESAFDGLVINHSSREVIVDGRVVQLTPREFDLLSFMSASPRQVFSRAQLLEQVWDSSPEWQDEATVTVHVRRLRKKIEKDPDEPRWITTVWGVGYRFEP